MKAAVFACSGLILVASPQGKSFWVVLKRLERLEKYERFVALPSQLVSV